MYGENVITLKNISKQYAPGQTVLQDIDLQINEGEIFGIIGRSGAGKSTLVRCMNLLEHPTSGQVYFDEADLTTLSSRALRAKRRQIGMIFQHFNLLESRTVAANIALPLELIKTPRAAIEKRVDELLKLVGLQKLSAHKPSELSGGQKQRVAIARALAVEPKVLLCDEATSALDPETTASILQLLAEINRQLNITIILITHEMDVIKQICDRVAVLEKGRLVEQGKVIDIFAKPQTETAKSLTQKALHVELPAVFLKQMVPQPQQGKHPVLRLAFMGRATEEPVLVNLVRDFNVMVNFLQADFEYIKEEQLGITICQLIAAVPDLQKALDYLQQQQVTIEVLGYA